MFIFNLPDELIENVIKFASRKHFRYGIVSNAVEIDLGTCRKLTMVDNKCHDKYWWSIGIIRVMEPIYIENFLNMAKYVMFELSKDASTQFALRQMYEIAYSSMDIPKRSEAVGGRGVIVPTTDYCMELYKALVKAFKPLTATVEQEKREEFKTFVLSIFSYMDFKHVRPNNLLPLDKALTLP